MAEDNAEAANIAAEEAVLALVREFGEEAVFALIASSLDFLISNGRAEFVRDVLMPETAKLIDEIDRVYHEAAN